MAAKIKLDEKSVGATDPVNGVSADIINGLMGGTQWNTSLFNSEDEPLTFSFIGDEWQGDEIAAIVSIIDSLDRQTGLEFQLNISDEAFAEYEEYKKDYKELNRLDIEINVVEDDDEALVAVESSEMRFFQDDLGGGTEGYANYPGSGSGGDVWFDTSTLDDGFEYTDYGNKKDPNDDVTYINDGSVLEGSYNYLLFLHEIGHALGLQHTFDNGRLGGLPEGFNDTVASDDGSVMSYNGWEDTDNLLSIWSANDLATLQYMYDIG